MPQLATVQPPTFLEWVRPPQQARTRETLTACSTRPRRWWREGLRRHRHRRDRAARRLVGRRLLPRASATSRACCTRCTSASARRRARPPTPALDPERWARRADRRDLRRVHPPSSCPIYREREGFFRAFLQSRHLTTPRFASAPDRLFEHLAERLAACSLDAPRARSRTPTRSWRAALRAARRSRHARPRRSWCSRSRSACPTTASPPS